MCGIGANISRRVESRRGIRAYEVPNGIFQEAAANRLVRTSHAGPQTGMVEAPSTSKKVSDTAHWVARERLPSGSRMSTGTGQFTDPVSATR